MKPTSGNFTEYDRTVQRLSRFLRREGEAGYVFAVSDDPALRSAVNHALAVRLAERGRQLSHLPLDPESDLPIREQIRRHLEEARPDALIVTGFDDFLTKNARTGELSFPGSAALLELNTAREFLNARGLPIVFWVTRENMALIGNRAADLFSQRRMGCFFFGERAKRERIY